MVRHLLGACLCLSIVSSTVLAQQSRMETRILIVIGPSNHAPGTHEVEAGARLMRHCLATSSNVSDLKVDVVKGWPNSESILDAAQTIVFIGDGFPPNRLPGKETILAKLGSLMNRGCGIVCVHYATGLHAKDVSPTGAHPLLKWMGGFSAFECPHHKTVARIFPTAKITPASARHPICRGWKEFTVHDEPYINNYFGHENNKPAPNVTALATSLLPPEKPKREIVSWCIQRQDQGRGFGVVMPHFYRSWKVDDLRKLILNGIVWSAGREVPPTGVKSQLPDLSKFKPESVEPKR